MLHKKKSPNIYVAKIVKSSTQNCENQGIGAALVILNLFLFRCMLFIINCHYTITSNIFHIILTQCVVITRVSKYLVVNFNPSLPTSTFMEVERSDEYTTMIHWPITLANTDF